MPPEVFLSHMYNWISQFTEVAQKHDEEIHFGKLLLKQLQRLVGHSGTMKPLSLVHLLEMH